ncbi:MAG: hypothetical protein JWN86_1666 [Planctomycetota bacterium]|nr:hypothetical protein [Planctomycetota bacterium]
MRSNRRRLGIRGSASVPGRQCPPPRDAPGAGTWAAGTSIEYRNGTRVHIGRVVRDRADKIDFARHEDAHGEIGTVAQSRCSAFRVKAAKAESHRGNGGNRLRRARIGQASKLIHGGPAGPPACASSEGPGGDVRSAAPLSTLTGHVQVTKDHHADLSRNAETHDSASDAFCDVRLIPDRSVFLSHLESSTGCFQGPPITQIDDCLHS